MKNVIIVDDEVHIRNLLKYLVHWEDLGLLLKGSYDNAADVIETMQHENIDIIITDIIMPEMDGLELIQTIKNDHPNCRFVLISGHRNFDYAKSAVRLGASDYIMKPLNEDEINNTLRKIVDDLKNDIKGVSFDAVYRQKFIDIINGTESALSRERVNEKYCMNFRATGSMRVLQLGICNSGDSESSERIASDILGIIKAKVTEYCLEYETYKVSTLRYNAVIQIVPGREEDFLRFLDITYRELVQKYKSITSARFYLAVGKEVYDLNELKDSAESAAFFLAGRLLYGNSRIYIADILPQAAQLQLENKPVAKELLRRFEYLVEAIDGIEVKKLIRQLFEDYQSRSESNPTLYFYMVFEVGEHLANVLNRLNIHPKEVKKIAKRLEELTEDCDSITMLRVTLERFCIETMNQYLGNKVDNTQIYVNYTKQYIEKNYDSQITLSIIAEKIHINSSYLSNIFKENTGMNYSAYLTSVRIEKAKELLQKLDFNISQIANKVGYTSSRYFSKTFEQETGMRPSEYRRIYLRRQRD